MRLEPGQSRCRQRRPAGRRPGDAGAAGTRSSSTLSVADNLTLAASYHGMPWAELDAALALLLPALALDAAARRTLLATPPNNSAPTTAAGCCCCARRSPRPPPG
ncbi:MAG: hypothetical protein U1E47_10065 [Rivihabitans pingtungensis]